MYCGNRTPIHFDHHYASQIEFGKPLVDSTFTLALVTGQSVTDVSQNVFANPVFEGDTIYSRSEVLEKRESRSRPDVGIIRVKTTGFNQDGTTVITFVRTIMVYKKDRAPKVARLTPGELAPDTSEREERNDEQCGPAYLRRRVTMTCRVLCMRFGRSFSELTTPRR